MRNPDPDLVAIATDLLVLPDDHVDALVDQRDQLEVAALVRHVVHWGIPRGDLELHEDPQFPWQHEGHVHHVLAFHIPLRDHEHIISLELLDQ